MTLDWQNHSTSEEVRHPHHEEGTTIIEPTKDLVRQQLQNDLKLLLSQYRNPEIGLRLVAEKINISEKTLKRALNAVCDPHANTLKSFYTHFFKVMNEEVTSLEIYQTIKKIIKTESLSKISFDVKAEETSSNELMRLLEQDLAFRQIFIFSRTGVVTQKWVIEQFGAYGVRILEQMVMLGILLEIDRGIYKQGPRGVEKSALAVKKIILELNQQYLDSVKLEERGENSAFYALEGLSLEAKEKLLEKLDNVKSEIAQFINDPKNLGQERVFVTFAMDVLPELEQEKDQKSRNKNIASNLMETRQ